MKEPDPYLVRLVRLLEKAHKDSRPFPQLEISLICGGTVVEGVLIPQEVFFERSHQLLQKFAELTDSAIAQVAMEEDTTTNEIERLVSEPFLHLRDVQFWIPGAPTDRCAEVGCWRVHVGGIDGFSFHDAPPGFGEQS